ncbi:hypothetical protein NDU88_000925 [Pleurodeles waltl]|uniref:Uncharacterized protein n=1 Tax=Pleurodeles waltl TaxID=8319 RepID=A0AAV7UT96_PLEWA|nr:hypothetical protein NDU88_000925 [Pleurodeles waltl]
MVDCSPNYVYLSIATTEYSQELKHFVFVRLCFYYLKSLHERRIPHRKCTRAFYLKSHLRTNERQRNQEVSCHGAYTLNPTRGFSGNLVRLQGGTGKKTEECLGKYISVFWGFLYQEGIGNG